MQDSLWGRQSVLEVNPGGDIAELSFGLENYEGGPEKQMLIQITFMPGYGVPMDFDHGSFAGDPGDPPWAFPNRSSAVVIDSYVHDDGWQTNSYGLTFEPNPAYEGFSILFTAYPAFIDQVVIDTWCVPEPATLGLLVLGGLALLRRRRERLR